MQRGQISRVRRGVWMVRWRDHAGVRRQIGGFPTQAEAQLVLDEELRKVRLGALYKPDMTLRQLVDVYLEQYDRAPASVEWLEHGLSKAMPKFGNYRLDSLRTNELSAWRATLASDAEKYQAMRALRQVLAAALSWRFVEHNPAATIPNPSPRRAEITPFESWAQVEDVAHEMPRDSYKAMILFAAGTGLRPEETFALEWRDVDLEQRTVTVQRAFAKGRLKDYPKTHGSRRRVPLRSRLVGELERLERGVILFPAPAGGHIDIGNWRSRFWVPAQRMAGVDPTRRIYDLRHTYATWSLAAGVNLFTLARRMGTSVGQIDVTYGHLAPNADDAERELLDAFDVSRGRVVDADEESHGT